MNMSVSVCMATYNGEKFVKQQLESILKQIDAVDEVIISDDSSTDNTLHVIKEIDDPRIKIFAGNMFRDPIQNFQNALRNASGDLIFLSDQDDIWMDGKYLEMKDLLLEYDLVTSDSIIVDEKLQEIESSFFKFFGSGKGIIKNMIRSSYYGSCMAFRKNILADALPFPNTKEIGHDLWIGLVAELTGKVYFYNKPLLLYRRHQSALTPEGIKSTRTFKQMLNGRIIMIKELIKFISRRKLKCKKD